MIMTVVARRIQDEALQSTCPRVSGASETSFMHKHLPRYVLRVLSWVGLLWLPEDVLTTLARRGTDVTVIVSPEDEQDFIARGGRAALDRLRRTSQPPRLIATPTGDHSAYHPAILAAIREAVLAAVAGHVGAHPRSGNHFGANAGNHLVAAAHSVRPGARSSTTRG